MTSFSFPKSLLIFIEFCIVFIFTNFVYTSPSSCVSECHFSFNMFTFLLTSFEVRKIHHAAWWQLFCFVSNSRALVPDNRSIECNSMFFFYSPKQQNLSQSPWKSVPVRDIYGQCMIISTPMQSVCFDVDHAVANLSMVLVREADDRLLPVMLFLCEHITQFFSLGFWLRLWCEVLPEKIAMCSRTMLTCLIWRQFGLDKFLPRSHGDSEICPLFINLNISPNRDLHTTYNEHNADLQIC